MKPGEEPYYDLVGNIMAYESGSLSERATLDLFAHLVKTGQAWTFQGYYGRVATALINGGLITKEGQVVHREEETPLPRFIVHHIAQYLTEGKDVESVRQAAKDARLDVRWVEEVPDRILRGFSLSQKPMEEKMQAHDPFKRRT